MPQLSKNEPAGVPDDDPWKNDVLERKAVAEYLTPVIGSIRQPFVVSLHSPYGTGKTYFLSAWKKHLENDGYVVAMFNAWETDFSQDALSAFLSALQQQFGRDEESPTSKKILELAKSAAGFVGKRGIPLLVKALVKRSIGEEGAAELKGVLDLSEGDLAQFAAALASEALSDQQAAEKSMTDFKIGLAELVKDAVSEKKGDRKKLIIMVDELDRCRPTYAIEVLEHIKHFFSVKDVVFVVAVDDAQIMSAVESVYGGSFDSEGYLRKFFDWRFDLPPPSPVSYSRFLTEKFGLRDLFDEGQRQKSLGLFPEVFGVFSAVLELSLRDQERSMSEIALALRRDRNWKESILIACGVLGPLRVKRRESVEGLLKNHEELSKFLEEFDQAISSTFSQLTNSQWKYFKFHVHSAFLDEDARNVLSTRLTILREKVNENNATQEHSDQTIRDSAKADYLTELLRVSNQYDNHLYGDQTWAKFANDALSGASQFIKQ